MDEITKMRGYIARTKIRTPRRIFYEMGAAELGACLNQEASADMVFLVFLYGRAKGYRLAKKEARNGN